MPRAAQKICSRCRKQLLPHGVRYCDSCAPKVTVQDVQYRGTAAARGYDHRWRALRNRYAEQHPFCEDCLELGRQVPTAIVDHKTPHRGDEALRTSWDNLRALCRSHHGRKSAAEGPGHRAPPGSGGGGIVFG